MSGHSTNVTQPELDAFDDNMVASVRFERGAISVVQNSWTSHAEHLRHGVIRTEGTAVIEGDGWWRLDRLTHATGDGDPTTVNFDEGTATSGGYAAETDAFLRCVAGGEARPWASRTASGCSTFRIILLNIT
jgi:predicted dehydrogenase